ncbi:MAG: hypothetical protein ICV65_04960, partial [Flavisolibacter sp.]|nr:hypothetical protein [Flavisolibacter sp.]
ICLFSIYGLLKRFSIRQRSITICCGVLCCIGAVIFIFVIGIVVTTAGTHHHSEEKT